MFREIFLIESKINSYNLGSSNFPIIDSCNSHTLSITLLLIFEARFWLWTALRNISFMLFGLNIIAYCILHCVVMHKILYLSLMSKNRYVDIVLNFNIEQCALLSCSLFNSLIKVTLC